ncbi:conjugative transposon protein TraM [Aggregatimonas sangjinii]|uniref:Conjugative transposon protein TraM n=1 Tax=Aggregatimonas sangjinii TaxID=2583587 RepID=A0A5B7SUA2_9FLAO|nr:conjugative transposon protein TraM [Aggregatimonas sangjinii]QCX00598.1 conjugative transposon protein TraM [Aggregatimonas sangjinii]
MKIQKNKIVFGSVLAVILIFLISYSIILMGDDESEDENLKQTLVPELDQEQKEYDSKLDAINDLKKVRETNAPSIYDEKLMDSVGFYDPEMGEKNKQRIVDSIYKASRINYSDRTYENIGRKRSIPKVVQEVDSGDIKREMQIHAKELGLEHQLFFASSPLVHASSILGGTDSEIEVVVDGNQVVKTNTRLRMRLTRTAKVNNKIIPKNTLIYGFISFQPNRALIEIENINHHPTKLKAFDLSDGSEGIYVENSFREEAATEVMDDIIGDINIPSVPQVSGITRIFRRNNRNTKAIVLNNYKLILKPKL